MAPSVKQETIDKKDSELHPECGPLVAMTEAGEMSIQIQRPPVKTKIGGGGRGNSRVQMKYGNR